MLAHVLWVLSVSWFVGEPIHTFGPFIDGEDCHRCAMALMDSRPHFAKRFPGRKFGPGYLCFEANPKRPEDWPPALKRSPCGE